MSQPVTIENDHLKLAVWPQFGGKVSSIVDKSDGYELLFSYPCDLPTRCQYGVPYADGWSVGWDECFPGIMPCTYPLHPYEKTQIPDHGELWPLPTTAVPTRDGITTVWHGLRFGYRITRKLYLEGPAVIAEYTLFNLAPFEFRFLWAMSAHLSVQSAIELDIGKPKLTGGASWPTLDEHTAFSRFDQLPAGCKWKRFTEAPIPGPARVLYPDRKRSLQIEYGSDAGVSGYWAIWVNTGKWEGHRHLAIEPTTGRSDVLTTAIEDDSAGRLAPMGRAEWRVALTVGA